MCFSSFLHLFETSTKPTERHEALAGSRRSFVRSVLFSLLFAVAIPSDVRASEKHAKAPKGVRVESYTGWEDSLVFVGAGAEVKAVVVPAIGGRIAHYSLQGENIIFERPESGGKTLANTQGNFSVGGYQCDLGPEIRGIPDHKMLWMGPYRWTGKRSYTIAVTSEPDATMGVQMEKEIVLDPKTGELGITQRMKNISEKETAFCLWDRTLCRGGGFVFFPLNPRSRFGAKWSVRNRVDGKYVYDGTRPESPKVKIMDGVLVAKAEGESAKVGADSNAEWIAYARGRLLFVKYYPYYPGGIYSDGGNSVEAYWDQRVAELEPLSPEIRLKPGTSYDFPEKWALIQLREEVGSFEQARALVAQIPASPFK